MPDEINPMRDLGFFPDKQAVAEPQDFLVPDNPTRGLCARFIPQGAKLYDLVDSYDLVNTFVLNRAEAGHSAGVMSLLMPFLKAFGATDYQVMRFFRDDVPLSSGAKDCAGYIKALMPFFLDTALYQHGADELCYRLGLNDTLTGASSLDLDSYDMSKKEARAVRGMAGNIVKLRLPRAVHSVNDPLELTKDEVKLIYELDQVFMSKFKDTVAERMVSDSVPVAANEKAYTLLDIRKTTQIELDGTMYIGSGPTDFQAMDLVKDGGGLSLAFNASEFALHGSNVAAISEDCTVAAFLASVFYDTGIQGVTDLAENWSKEYVAGNDFPDNNLRDRLLSAPGKFPLVFKISRDNVDGVCELSEKFRTKIRKKTELASAKPAE